MIRRFLFVLVLFGLAPVITFGQDVNTISGYITDANDGEPLAGVNVYIAGTTRGTITNEYGFYSFSFPESEISITFQYLGYENQVLPVETPIESSINIELVAEALNLGAVEIVADRTAQREALQSAATGVIRIKAAQIRQLPALVGETDLIKAIQLLPGVSRGSEGTSGMFVRGGASDQNLVLLDEASLYEISHLFGFFSLFNEYAIKDVTLTRSGFPSKYGGRLSSVLDIRMREGNTQKLSFKAGIGLLSSRFSVESPLFSDKVSFMLAGRRTYIDQVFAAAGQQLPYYFYDINAKINYRASNKNRFYYSRYSGNDILAFDDGNAESAESDSANFNLGFGFELGNTTRTFRWNHIFSDRVFSNLSLIYTRFKYDIRGNVEPNELRIESRIEDVTARYDITYYKSAGRQRNYGIDLTIHSFRPNLVTTRGDVANIINSREAPTIDTIEFATYWMETVKLNEKISYKIGLRWSGLLTETQDFSNLEPRLNIRYSISDDFVLKSSYARMSQYMHRVSSSSVSLPTDLWYPASKKAAPQTSDQLSIGASYLSDKVQTMFSAEAYYKWMWQLHEYREGANLILNDNFEDELVSGRGWSYGVELLAKKDDGKLTGWIGYTLSWTRRQFDEINGGEAYFDRFDRRHDLSIVAAYQLGSRFSASAVWVYATGSRFTPISGQYFQPEPGYGGVDVIPIYPERNSIELSPSHRLDVSLVYHSNPAHRLKREFHIGAYNLYNRTQPYRVAVEPDGKGGYVYKQYGLFGFIPSIAYNISF